MTEPGRLTAEQWAALQEAIDGTYVEKRVERNDDGDPIELAHIAHWYVRAKLIQIFGYCNYDVETLSLQETLKEKLDNGRIYFLHTAQVRLHIKDREGKPLAFYDDVACGDGKGDVRVNGGTTSPGKACHRSATTALSLALVRCTNNLGDQFGLSLYNKGSLDPVVGSTLLDPAAAEIPTQREDEDELLHQAADPDYTAEPEDTQ